MSKFSAMDAISIFMDRAIWCRENGESDMRIIIYSAASIKRMIEDGKSREEIMKEFFPDGGGSV